ncbi:MAG: hypothetical protein QNJ20_08920 [Paracoccaceae bacterium]|nr:hypothetical protein [Paracoccaceae bacterium]
MPYDDHLTTARAELEAARRALQDELRNYPTPVSGCDAQYNHLIGLRGSITAALRALEAPRFVATPRTPDPLAGVESR